jgi:hypothetical protein
MNPKDYSRNIKVKLDRQTGQLCFYDPDHPLARKNGMVWLSRHQLSLKLGRWLQPGETAQYLDGNPKNLAPENLVLASFPELANRTHVDQAELVCPYCGEVFRVARSHKDRRMHCKDKCRRLHSRKFAVEAEELEQLVWLMPTTEVAQLFGVSDKAIEKRCKLLGIPKPPRGYWTKNATKEQKQNCDRSDQEEEE